MGIDYNGQNIEIEEPRDEFHVKGCCLVANTIELIKKGDHIVPCMHSCQNDFGNVFLRGINQELSNRFKPPDVSIFTDMGYFLGVLCLSNINDKSVQYAF